MKKLAGKALLEKGKLSLRRESRTGLKEKREPVTNRLVERAETPTDWWTCNFHLPLMKPDFHQQVVL